MKQAPNLLRVPGPSPIPPSVQSEMNRPMISHRTPEGEEIIERIREKIGPVFGTEQEVIVIAGSGTLALETSVLNVTSPGDEVLVLVTGEFGDHYARICETNNLKVHRIDSTWGDSVDLDLLKEKLQSSPNIKAVFATQSETSTSVLNPIKEIASIVKENSNALTIVDGVSSIGGADMQMDEWGVDIVATGSQKAMMLPPGLAFVALSERAWKAAENNQTLPYYMDLLICRDFWLKNSTPHTPALSLLNGLNEVLELFHKEGMQNVYKRHELMKDMVRSAMKALNIPLLAEDEFASPTVTAIKPDAFDAESLRGLLKEEFGLDFAGGLKHLQGKIIRIGHMGYCHPSDVLTMISLIELGLERLNAPVKLGEGVKAAQEVYLAEQAALVK